MVCSLHSQAKLAEPSVVEGCIIALIYAIWQGDVPSLSIAIDESSLWTAELQKCDCAIEILSD